MSGPTVVPQATGYSRQRDWPSLLVAALALAWIMLLSYLAHGITWLVEQFFIIDDAVLPGWVWPVVTLVHGILIAPPLILLAFFWRAPRYRALFQTWALASISIFFLVLPRFAPFSAAQQVAVLQIIALVCYLVFLVAVILLRRARGGRGFIRPRGPLMLALLLPPLLTWGWIAWGALGSPVDTLLNFLVALLFGLTFGLLISHFLVQPLRYVNPAGLDYLVGGWGIGGTLLIAGAALGCHGQQLILMLMLPPLGRTIIALSRLGARDDHDADDVPWVTAAVLLGLVAAAPLSLVDPDELVLVLNMGSVEIMHWTLYATFATMLTTWVTGFVLSAFAKRLLGPGTRYVLPGAVLAAWLLASLLYFTVGQPGFYGERLFVILKDQADLSSVATIPDYAKRRQHAYETLVAHAEATQADLRAALDRLHISYTPYYLVNALEVDGGPLVRLWLSSRPEVGRILDNPILRPLPAPRRPARGYEAGPTSPPWNITAIGADRVWEELGVTGEGIVVGQSDSGVQWDHPELAASYRGRDGVHDYNWYDPWYHTTVPNDVGGHGTHTLATIVGQHVGVAPGATWYACVNLGRNLGNPARYLDCLQFMLAPFPLGGDPFRDGDPARGAHVINNSWGCPDIEGCDPLALVEAARALRVAGVFVVAAAGNEGDNCGSIAAPLALYDEVFTVGAVDSGGSLAFFSGRGPVTADGSQRVKPDVVAPGVDVLSAYPGGTYEYAGGTSMAAPHVAGVVALMWSANPQLIGNIELTERIITETARPYEYSTLGFPACAGDGSYPNNAVGYGLVDAYAAVRRALDLRERGGP
ncbi:MAG: S8 family serine peptidase [Anaerolineae bacterium]|nr:S8 family serine peptidase [Anaerolineae bacterium]